MSNVLFGRVYELKLDEETYKGGPGVNSLDIRFEVDFARGQLCRMGSVSILGLGVATMTRYLELSILDRGTALSRGLHVSLKVGYQNGPMIDVISGTVYNATISAPPDMWLTLEIQEFDPTAKSVLWGKPIVQVKSDNTSAAASLEKTSDQPKNMQYKKKDVAQELLSQFNENYKFVDKTSTNVGDETIESFETRRLMESQAVKAIQALSYDWVVVKNGDTFTAYSSNVMEETRSSIKVNSQSGLRSVSGISYANAQITSLLSDPEPTLIDLELESELNPQANGRYTILGKKYFGHFMGREWFIQYDCVRKRKA